jgi:stress response protein SCP2
VNKKHLEFEENINFVNSTYLKKRNKIIILDTKFQTAAPKKYTATLLKNVESLGYTFSKDLVDKLLTLSKKEIETVAERLMRTLKFMVGAHNYKPMYPNFPTQVMEAEESDLFMNATLHYLGDVIGTRVVPTYRKKVRTKLDESEVELKVISLGTIKDFCSIFTNLLSAKVAVTEEDKEIIKTMFTMLGDEIEEYMPEEIPLKENIALVSMLLAKDDTKLELIKGFLKTPTDILRYLVAVNNGDISLAKPTKFGPISNAKRKFVMSKLHELGMPQQVLVENLASHREVWKRLAKKIHPFTFKKKYPKVTKAFKEILAKGNVETYNSKVESNIRNKQLADLLKLLSERPGVFARRLDHILRVYPEQDMIIEAFSEVANQVSTPVLLQCLAHFSNRNTPTVVKTILPKGNEAKIKVLENTAQPFTKKVCNKITDILETALKDNFETKGKLGKVYIAPELVTYNVPFALRSASKTLKTLVRGSRSKIESGITTLRSFVYWKQAPGDRVDIDLSAVFVNENFELVDHVSFRSLRAPEIKCAHSGDITSAPDGASEFIDISLEDVKKSSKNIRYIGIVLQMYTSQKFVDVPICYMGYMGRTKPGSGEIYEPATVKMKIDVSSQDNSMIMPMMFDVQTGEMIWTDISIKNLSMYENSVVANKMTLGKVMQGLAVMRKPDLYTLFRLNAEARGKIVKSIDAADVICSLDKGVTPFDIDKIIGEWM